MSRGFWAPVREASGGVRRAGWGPRACVWAGLALEQRTWTWASPAARLLPRVGAHHGDENRSTRRLARPPAPRPGGDVGNVSAEQKATGRGCAPDRHVPSPVRPVGGRRRRPPKGRPGPTVPPSHALLAVDDGTETAPGLPEVPVPSAGSFGDLSSGEIRVLQPRRRPQGRAQFPENNCVALPAPHRGCPTTQWWRS